MSAILKGLLQPAIQGVLTSLATGTPPSAVATNTDPITAQAAFADRLSTAIATSIQQYLLTNVTVIPGIPVATTGGPAAQVGATTAPGKLQAP